MTEAKRSLLTRRFASQDSGAASVSHPEARFFEQLDSRNRYAILYRLHDAKKPDTRLRRLEKFVRMLEAGQTIY